MKSPRILASALIASLFCLAAFAPVAQAAPAPAWALQLNRLPANFAAGSQGEFFAIATNVGAEATSGKSLVKVTLPAELTPKKLEEGCSYAAPVVSCETTDPVASGQVLTRSVKVDVSPTASGTLTATAGVSGGGASQEILAAASAPVQSAPVPFGFLPPGLTASLSEEDGAPGVLAGSHPFQQTVAFNFPTQLFPRGSSGGFDLTNAGHPRDIVASLPAGLVGDPAASPVLCTEAQLQAGKCPPGSQVGAFDVTTLIAEGGFNGIGRSPLFNMVPLPGAPAELATDVAGVGIFAHLIASVRSDGDYGIDVSTPDVLALGTQPIFGIQTQVWGDPTSTVHDANRECESACEIEPQNTALWTLPSSCNGQPIQSSVRADSWEEPGDFKEASYQSADLAGNPVASADCGGLDFKPTLKVQPTTNLIDSPSGLDVALHQPQDTELGHRSSAALKDATVTLPAGMSVNPSQADGLGACSAAQIGLSTAVGASPVHFDKTPNSCPDNSKLGTVEVTTPLLVQREDGGTKLATDPETGQALLEPLHGSVYLANPFDNPFGSLLAIYLAVEDPKTGTIAKLAGRVTPDPQSGQLTTRFEENPQLPLEDIRLHLFGGARASLITPPICGDHTTSSQLTPWSAPEGADATPSDSFQSSAAPGGGACPSSEGAAPNSRAFSAGTLGRRAGEYSPFVLKISREDGSQRLSKIDTTLPPGLAARFAGVPECSEAQLATAKSREAPNLGALEQTNPSCPKASELGTVDVAAGAGPTPFYAKGHVYLSGPYKGAPLSLAIITPAVAGPFDLGAVLSRVALYVDPATAQGHAVSDSLPTIIDGIPLDVRSVAISLDRPEFTLNPTSCDPMAITGAATSSQGQTAALTTPFQVGGCSQLPFKPKLSLRLKGGTKRAAHPKLIANLAAKPGEANIAKAQVKLPPSAFLDQAHIRTVCTRVQFAATACPAGSIYGTASAVTPLLSDPLAGNVYLRSSNHKLPDLVVALKGPASLPIEIDLAGKTDSVKGALRNTFEAVPDAPVSKFHLELFGGKRGLVINSRNLCAHRYKAEVKLTGQNGKAYDTNPAVRTDCKRSAHKRQTR